MSVFTSLLNNSFAVYRRGRTADGQGGWTISYTDLGDIDGRIRPATSTEREVAQSEERQISHVFYCSHGEDVGRGDRLVCGDLTVEVMGLREPSKASHHLEIDCLERQQEENS